LPDIEPDIEKVGQLRILDGGVVGRIGDDGIQGFIGYVGEVVG
jgi:hypothetical protein